MRLAKSRPSGTIAFNMTPMIDIVFLLIIFFMTVSQITRTVDIPLELPQVAEGSNPTQPSSITINLNAKGEIIVASKKMSVQNVVSTVKKKLEQKNNDPNQIKIQLRCDRNCESRFVNRLVEKLSALGFTQIRTAVAD